MAAAPIPQTTIQTYIVHLIRNSMVFANRKHRKTILGQIQGIYKAETEELALQKLDTFEVKWRKKYPAIEQASRQHSENVVLSLFKPATSFSCFRLRSAK